MKKSFKATIETEEFGRDFEDDELAAFIVDRLSFFWKTHKVEKINPFIDPYIIDPDDWMTIDTLLHKQNLENLQELLSDAEIPRATKL